MTRQARGWKPWGDHPVVVGIVVLTALIGAVIGILSLYKSEQQIAFVGRVLDSNTAARIRAAKVALDFQGTSQIVYTDSEGVFRFSLSLRNKSMAGHVRVEAGGYELYDRNLTLTIDSTELADIRMTALVAEQQNNASTPQPTTSPKEEPEPTPDASTPQLTASPKGEPEPTSDVSTSGDLGDTKFQVINTGTEGLFLRSDHNSDQPQIKVLPTGTIVTVIGSDFVGSDRVWKHIREPGGAEGWVAAEFLQAMATCGPRVDLGNTTSDEGQTLKRWEDAQNNQPPGISGDNTLRTFHEEYAAVDLCGLIPNRNYKLSIEAQNSGCKVQVIIDEDPAVTLNPDPDNRATKVYDAIIYVRTTQVTVLFRNLPTNNCTAPGIYNVALQIVND